MNANTITVTLKVNDDGSVVMQQFGKNSEDALNKTSKAAPKATSALDSLKSSYVDMAAKAATAYMAITKAMDYMDQGAKATQAEESFRTLAAAAGESADQIIADMKRATNSTIDDSDMMLKANKAMMLDFTGDQIEQMAEMARMGARVTGENVSQAFDTIVDGISTNMPKALKKYGLVTKEQMGIINQAMAEGVTDVNLFSVAQANMAGQQAKMGPLFGDQAEKMQQYSAAIKDAQDKFGKLLLLVEGFTIDKISNVTGMFASIAASLANGSSEPFKAWQVDISGDAVGLNQAQEELKRYQARLKAAQEAAPDSGLSGLGDITRQKAALETLKALDKDYFSSQEAQIKALAEIKKAAGEDDYQISFDSLQRQEALNAEYYTRTKTQIEKTAATRQKADKDKITDASFIAQEMQKLDADTASKAANLMQQRTLLSVQTAQEDIANLTSRLGEYRAYYDSLKAKMDKNIEDEKKHLEELKALRQQSVDLDKSAEAQLALINGTDKNQTSQQAYETGRSALNQQFMDITNNTEGAERIKELDVYMQKVTALQQQFPQGVQGPKNIFGDPQDIISAAKVASDASSDINRALALQQSAVTSLAEAKKTQTETDQLYFQMLQEEAAKSQTEMEKLKTTMSDLSNQILNMEKTVTLTGVDDVSSVVDGIIKRIEDLHKLAAQEIKFNVVSGGSSSSFGGSSSANTNPFLNLNAKLKLDGYAEGTNYVPRTGPYILHQGEAVVPAAENNGGKSVTFGDVIIQIPANAAPQSKEDWRAITRNYIVPELRKLQ